MRRFSTLIILLTYCIPCLILSHSVNLTKVPYLLYIFLTSSTMLLEPLFCTDDISTYKFVFRSLLIFGNLVIYFLFNTQLSDFVKCIIFYAVGYVVVSSIVQYYSLFVANKNIPHSLVPEDNKA